MGVTHDILRVPAPAGEDEPRLPGEPAHVYVRRTARDKAVRARHWVDGGATVDGKPLDRARPILSADTTVILDGDILGKPADTEDAAAMLARLSGRSHSVHTAIALSRGAELLEDVSITEVRFKPLSLEEIRAYCATGEPMGKAGAYGIQGLAGLFVEYISGSYTGVMGLPVFETGRLLRSVI